jgi:citrate synthase
MGVVHYFLSAHQAMTLPRAGLADSLSLRMLVTCVCVCVCVLAVGPADKLVKSMNESAAVGMFISAVSVMSTYHADANPSLAGRDIYDEDEERHLRNKQMYRILGKLPTIAACAMRHRMGRPYNYPDATGTLSYTENFLGMIDRLSEPAYRPHPALAKALDVLFIVHADHELNCSTAALRHLASTRVDPYTGVAGAAAALYGPLHGGASEGVVRMLGRIGTVDAVPGFLARVRAKKELLVGFGHRVYRALDPRARILQRYADEVFAVVGRDPLTDVALALASAARRDAYFVSRRLYPNVDFYSGLIYRALGFPLDAFPLLFALPRAAGWLAHWAEALDADDAALVRAGATRVTRPTQVWGGCADAVPPVPAAAHAAGTGHVSDGATDESDAPLASVSSGTSVRRRAAAAATTTTPRS